MYTPMYGTGSIYFGVGTLQHVLCCSLHSSVLSAQAVSVQPLDCQPCLFDCVAIHSLFVIFTVTHHNRQVAARACTLGSAKHTADKVFSPAGGVGPNRQGGLASCLETGAAA